MYMYMYMYTDESLYVVVNCSAQTGQHEACMCECYPTCIGALQLICWKQEKCTCMSCMYNVHIVIQNWLLVQHECLIHVHIHVYISCLVTSNKCTCLHLTHNSHHSTTTTCIYTCTCTYMYMYMHIHYIQHVYMYIYNISNMYTCMSADVQVQEI